MLSIILLYNKEVASRTFCSLSASASLVASTIAETAWYDLLIVFLIQLVIFFIGFLFGFRGQIYRIYLFTQTSPS